MDGRSYPTCEGSNLRLEPSITIQSVGLDITLHLENTDLPSPAANGRYTRSLRSAREVESWFPYCRCPHLVARPPVMRKRQWEVFSMHIQSLTINASVGICLVGRQLVVSHLEFRVESKTPNSTYPTQPIRMACPAPGGSIVWIPQGLEVGCMLFRRIGIPKQPSTKVRFP